MLAFSGCFCSSVILGVTGPSGVHSLVNFYTPTVPTKLISVGMTTCILDLSTMVRNGFKRLAPLNYPSYLVKNTAAVLYIRFNKNGKKPRSAKPQWLSMKNVLL